MGRHDYTFDKAAAITAAATPPSARRYTHNATGSHERYHHHPRKFISTRKRECGTIFTHAISISRYRHIIFAFIGADYRCFAPTAGHRRFTPPILALKMREYFSPVCAPGSWPHTPMISRAIFVKPSRALFRHARLHKGPAQPRRAARQNKNFQAVSHSKSGRRLLKTRSQAAAECYAALVNTEGAPITPRFSTRTPAKAESRRPSFII